MRSRFRTLFWILGSLFPGEALGRLWRSFERVFNDLFAAEWTHGTRHTFLNAVLVFLRAQRIRPVPAGAIFLILGLAVVIGCFQEGLQWLSIKSEIAWPASAFDLRVDFGGARIGLVLASLGPSRLPGRSVSR